MSNTKNEQPLIFNRLSIDFLNSALGRRLVVVMISCSSLLALILTGFELSASYRQGISEIESMHKELTLVHGDVLVQQIWSLDELAAEVSIEGLARLKGIDRVELNWEGHVLMSVGEEIVDADLKTVLPLFKLQDGKQFQLGELKLFSTLEHLRLEIVSLLGVRLFLNLLKTLVVSCVVLYFFHRIATVHLQAISRHADAFAFGENYQPLTLTRGGQQSKDELQTLVDAINGMGYRLQEDYIRREHHQSDLELLVGQRTRHLEDVNRKLLEKSRLATIGSLVAMVAHELRNPLGSIKASISLLSARCHNAEDAHAIRRIERNIDRCDETVEQLRRMSNKSVQHWDVLNLAVWMTDYVENKLQIDKRIEVRCEFSPGLMVFVDQFQLDMVVRNLFENADQAMTVQQSQVISLTLTRVGERALLQVTDNGTGLKHETLRHAFDPLYSTKQYGFGMGLTLSRNLVESLGGELELSSQGENRGATVSLWLPLVGTNTTV